MAAVWNRYVTTRPVAFCSLPNLQIYVQSSPHATPLIVVADASNVTTCSRSGAAGERLNAAAGAAGPTSRIDIERETELSKFCPTGVATMDTASTALLLGGATNPNVARPSGPVTTSLAESVPPLAGVSPRRMRWPETGRPCASRAVTVTVAMELPSRETTSGVAAMVSDSPNSDGPVRDGGVSFSIEHPPSVARSGSAAAATANRRMNDVLFMMVSSPRRSPRR